MASNMTINYQFLNFSPQPSSLYRVTTKITQTDLSTWMPYWTLKLHGLSITCFPPSQTRSSFSVLCFRECSCNPAWCLSLAPWHPLHCPKHCWLRLLMHPKQFNLPHALHLNPAFSSASLMTFPPKVLILLSLWQVPNIPYALFPFYTLCIYHPFLVRMSFVPFSARQTRLILWNSPQPFYCPASAFMDWPFIFLEYARHPSTTVPTAYGI